MGGIMGCMPFGQEGQRSSTRPDGAPWADVVVKIGGSACTKKAQFETLNTEALSASSAQLAKLSSEGLRMAIVHGAGSFGHQHAKEYGVSKGTGEASFSTGPLPERLREGFAKTRLSVTTLNKHVISALVKEGLPAVAMSPCPFVGTCKKKLIDGILPASAAEGAMGLLKCGMVPVVHGDAVLDASQGCAILSGDVWMVELCRELGAKSAVFVTDVDGVFTKPPTEPGAQLVKEILVDAKTGEMELTGVSMNCASHDVTGGLKAKLESAADVLRGAPSVQAVYIVRAGSDAAAQAMRGVAPTYGTTLRRRQ
eukprot:gb/GFBE01008163.1/.p1 GENE.gb/GFBE01008163.1/~~gb/GFBE01008163.1/.p1  ORF type:complete len:311 (+),score=61.58 gb/GFBE01008163.1/:1-933(+)